MGGALQTLRPLDGGTGWGGSIPSPRHLQALRGSGHVLQGGWVEVSYLRNRTSEGIYSRGRAVQKRGSFFVFTE